MPTWDGFERFPGLICILPFWLPYGFVFLRVYQGRTKSGLVLAGVMACALLVPGVFLLRFVFEWEKSWWIKANLGLALLMQPLLVLTVAVALSSTPLARRDWLRPSAYGISLFALFWLFYSPVPLFDPSLLLLLLCGYALWKLVGWFGSQEKATLKWQGHSAFAGLCLATTSTALWAFFFVHAYLTGDDPFHYPCHPVELFCMRVSFNTAALGFVAAVLGEGKLRARATAISALNLLLGLAAQTTMLARHLDCG